MLTTDAEDYEAFIRECAPKLLAHDTYCFGCAKRMGGKYNGTTVYFFNPTTAMTCPVCKQFGEDTVLHLTVRC